MCFLTQRSKELLLGDSRVTMHDACAMTNMHSSDLFSDARSNECCALLSSWAMEQHHHFHPHYWHSLMRHLASTSFAPPTQRRMRRRTALQPLKPPLLSLQAEMLHRGFPSCLEQIHAIRERSEQPSLFTLVSTCEPSNGEEYSAPSANKMSTKLMRLRKTRWWTRH